SQARDLSLARTAPGSPEVEEGHLAALFREADALAVDVGQREIRSGIRARRRPWGNVPVLRWGGPPRRGLLPPGFPPIEHGGLLRLGRREARMPGVACELLEGGDAEPLNGGIRIVQGAHQSGNRALYPLGAVVPAEHDDLAGRSLANPGIAIPQPG